MAELTWRRSGLQAPAKPGDWTGPISVGQASRRARVQAQQAGLTGKAVTSFVQVWERAAKGAKKLATGHGLEGMVPRAQWSKMTKAEQREMKDARHASFAFLGASELLGFRSEDEQGAAAAQVGGDIWLVHGVPVPATTGSERVTAAEKVGWEPMWVRPWELAGYPTWPDMDQADLAFVNALAEWEAAQHDGVAPKADPVPGTPSTPSSAWGIAHLGAPQKLPTVKEER